MHFAIGRKMRCWRAAIIVLMSLICNGLLAQRHISISKTELKLAVVENGDTVFSCPICVGKNYGNKERKFDKKTPEGAFSICSIENSSHWKHDFNDGMGLRKGAYGPYFFRLKVPGFKSIGIHGTCIPESIGTRSSEGCIRLDNTDLLNLRPLVFVGMKCIIGKD